MADAIISAVVGEAISRVISLVTGNFTQKQSTEAKLQRICHLLIRIHSVVEEAKGHQIENQGVLQWLSELIDSEYEGRYLLDTIGCGEHELEDDKKAVSLPHASSLSLLNPAKRMRVAANAAVKSVMSCRAHSDDEIDRVLQRSHGVSRGLTELIMLLQGYPTIRRPLATNIFLEGQMFGRHVEREKIINFLLRDCGSNSTGQLGVLPIVGDIGVGKKTLVQHACGDPRVRSHFPVMLFNFSCTYAIATSESTVVLQSKHVIGEGGIDMKDPLQLIKRGFGNKRFLMVFEDVDMCKKQMLEELLPSLRCGAKGTKIIFTTNNRRFVSMGTVEPIKLKVLPQPEYWFFFKAHAFAGRDVEENPSLTAAGKAIARKLNGSFFGAKIVGEFIRDHPDPTFWCKVLRSNVGGLSLLGDGISKDRYSSQKELFRMSRFQGLREPLDRGAAWMEDDVVFARILLVKSVLPFYNQRFIASCTA